MTKEITPNQGFGELLLGMTMAAAEAIIGKADSIENMDVPEEEAVKVATYTDRGLTLFFSATDGVLSCIEIVDSAATLFDHSIFDMQEKEVVALMAKHGFSNVETDIEDWGERHLSFTQANMDCFYEEGELVSIMLGK